MVYKWKTPVYSKVSAQVAGEHIEELEKEHGEVTPQILLDDSRPEDAVLHCLFEWDDTAAAEKWRIQQSKNIVGNLVAVSVESSDSEDGEVRAFVNINNRNEKASYISTVTALSNKETKQRVLRNAEIELEMFTKKYSGLINVASILEEALRKLTS